MGFNHQNKAKPCESPGTDGEQVKSAYHLLGLSHRSNNPKNTKTKPFTNQIFMAKKGRQRTQRLPTPTLYTQTADNPGGFHTFFVSWGFRRSTVSSTGHRNVSRWVRNVSREGDSRPRPCSISLPDLWGHRGQAAHQCWPQTFLRKPSLALPVLTSQCHT